MSRIAELQEKVAKAEEKVEKCKKTIEKHETQLAKKIASGDSQSDIKWKQEDIKGATKKMEAAQIILENWKVKLNIEIEKERFLNDNAPQVIKDFLEQWKQMAYDWHVKRYEDYLKYKEELKEDQKASEIEYIESQPEEFARYLDENGKISEENYRWATSTINKGMEKHLKEKELDWKSIKSRLTSFAGVAVLHMATYYNEKERLAWLEKTLEAEKQAKMLDLIDRINKVVGTITDATTLRIKAGNLNGIIVGEKGKAKVETIGAGGYNIQCFHYRTLVHEVN